MPTYEYQCDACGERFEKFQSITAPAIKKCPKCGKNKARRLISSGAGILFKGSGFYITDYRDKSYTDKAKAETGGGETKSTETKTGDTAAKPAATEAKPVATTDTKAAPPAPAPKPEAKSHSAKPSSKKTTK